MMSGDLRYTKARALRRKKGRPGAPFHISVAPSIFRRENRRLRRVVGGQILDVVLRQRRRKAFHDRVLALRALVIAERLCEIVAMLSGEARKIGCRAVA